MPAPAYSDTPLAKKLGIKKGFVVRLINQPAAYFSWFTDLPATLVMDAGTGVKKQFIHIVCTESSQLYQQLASLKNEIVSNGSFGFPGLKKQPKYPPISPKAPYGNMRC